MAPHAAQPGAAHSRLPRHPWSSSQPPPQARPCGRRCAGGFASLDPAATHAGSAATRKTGATSQEDDCNVMGKAAPGTSTPDSAAQAPTSDPNAFLSGQSAGLAVG